MSMAFPSSAFARNYSPPQNRAAARRQFGFRPPSQTVTGDERGGLAAAAPDQRPPPFEMGAAQTPWGPSYDPFNERMGIVQQQQMQNMQRQLMFNNTSFSQPQTWNQSPSFDMGFALQQAGLDKGSPTWGGEARSLAFGPASQGSWQQPGGFQYGPPQSPWQAQPIQPPSQGTPYNPMQAAAGWPSPPQQPSWGTWAANTSPWGPPQPAPQPAPAPAPPQAPAPAPQPVTQQSPATAAVSPSQAQPVQPPSQGTPYQEPASAKAAPTRDELLAIARDSTKGNDERLEALRQEINLEHPGMNWTAPWRTPERVQLAAAIAADRHAKSRAEKAAKNAKIQEEKAAKERRDKALAAIGGLTQVHYRGNPSTEALEAVAKVIPDQVALAARGAAESKKHRLVTAQGVPLMIQGTQWAKDNNLQIGMAQRAIESFLEAHGPEAAGVRQAKVQMARSKFDRDPEALAAFDAAIASGMVTNAGLDNLMRYGLQKAPSTNLNLQQRMYMSLLGPRGTW